MSSNSAGDGDLVTAARKGDEAAFAEVYLRCRGPVYRFAWRLSGSGATAEEVTQECFLALLKGAAYQERHGTLQTYLIGVARHMVLRRMRHSGRETDELPDMAGDGDPLQELLAEERSAAVERAVRRLPVLQREAVILFEYEDLSLEEIAAVTGAEVNAVKGRLFRARETLRQRLAGLMPQRSCG